MVTDRTAPPRPCIHCGLDFKPNGRGNHGNLCSALCRFFSKVEFSEHGCWIWKAALSSDGYGLFREPTHGTPYAHRWSFGELSGESLVDGLTIDHLCRNRACVNPEHLEQVTHAENMHRSAGKGRRLETHCKRGHEFTKENTGWQTNGTKRYCRQCHRDRGARLARKYRARKSAERKAMTNA